MRTMVQAPLAAFLMSVTAGGAIAKKCIALVIGNFDYELISPLPNPANDARLMADALREFDAGLTPPFLTPPDSALSERFSCDAGPDHECAISAIVAAPV